MPVDHRPLVEAIQAKTPAELEIENLCNTVNRLEEYIKKLEKHIGFRNGDMLLKHTKLE